MSESHITEKALAESLKQLMKKKPLAKISINHIVENCGLNRQTFYYHFKDKYELVNWIYYTEAVSGKADCSNYNSWGEEMHKTLEYLMKNKLFYINAFSTSGQNAFDGYFFENTFDLIMGIINNISLNMNIDELDKKFIADFYTNAFVGITVQWVKNDTEISSEILVDKLNKIVDGSMLGALKRYAHK